MHKIFRYPKFSETLKGSPWNFSALWDKKFSTENLDTDTPPPFYPNFFDTRNYCNSKGFTYGNFRHCETKNFWRKILTLPPSLIQTFSVPEISETLKGSPTKFFGTVRQKKFDKKSWNSPPPLLSINFFATGNFLKHGTEVFTYQIFRHCETKKIGRKSWHNPLKHKIFRHPKLMKHQRIPPYLKFRHCETKNFRRKILIPPPPSPLPLSDA